jgi:hypothetical protein
MHPIHAYCFPTASLHTPLQPYLAPFFELHSWNAMTIQHSMFGLAVTMLLSDKVLGSDNWLSEAPDPRPDQLPNPVRSLQAIFETILFQNFNSFRFLFLKSPFSRLGHRHPAPLTLAF